MALITLKRVFDFFFCNAGHYGSLPARVFLVYPMILWFCSPGLLHEKWQVVLLCLGLCSLAGTGLIAEGSFVAKLIASGKNPLDQPYVSQGPISSYNEAGVRTMGAGVAVMIGAFLLVLYAKEYPASASDWIVFVALLLGFLGCLRLALKSTND